MIWNPLFFVPESCKFSRGKKSFNNPGRQLEILVNIGAAAASKNPKLFPVTAPDVINFVHQERACICIRKVL